MTKKQAEIIYDMASKDYRISKTSIFIMIEDDVAKLVKEEDTIYVILDCSHRIKLEEYPLESVKLIQNKIPCNHLNKLKERNINGITF